MALSIPSGFIVGVNEPIDGRIAVTSRLSQSAFTAYLGLIVYDITEGKVYFLNDITDPSLAASWTEVGSGTGTSTTVVGTSGQVVVSTVDDTATVSLDTAITGAITVNTAKNSYPTEDSNKLAGIENGADITDTINVVGSLTAGTNISIGIDGTISATGSAGGTSDYDDLTNAPITRLRQVDQFTLSGTRTNVAEVGTNELSTITIINTYNSTGGRFSYDPDTSNSVYSTSVFAKTFDSPGSNITTNLTFIANQIAALETNITWDGVITSTTIIGDQISGTPTIYGQQNADRWCFSTASDGGSRIDLDFNDSWSTLDGTYLAEGINDNGTYTAVVNNGGVGTVVRITLGGRSADFEVTELGTSTTANIMRLGTATNIIGGNIGTSASNGSRIGLNSRIFLPASSVTLDLGTTSNISSSFTLLGGTNANETLVNQNGTGPLGISSTVIVRDGNGNQVGAFTAGVLLSTDSNIDEVGQMIADEVNENNETPINFNGSYDSSTKVITVRATSAGDHDAWTITISNNNASSANEGNLVVSAAVAADEVINQIDILTLATDASIVFSDGTEQSSAGVESVLGTANEINVNTSNSVSTASLATPIKSAIAGNTAGLLTKGDGLATGSNNSLSLLRGVTPISTVILPSATDYDLIGNAPIERVRQVDRFTLSGNRTNVIALGGNEMSTLTLRDSYSSYPLVVDEYTTIGGRGFTTFSPAITSAAGVVWTLTTINAQVFRFVSNGTFFRYIDPGITGTLTRGTTKSLVSAVFTTETFNITADAADQTIVILGDVTDRFAVGDFVSNSNTVLTSAQGFILTSVLFSEGHTTLTGLGVDAATFTTSTSIYTSKYTGDIIGASNYGQFSYDPDVNDTVYTNRVFTTTFNVVGQDILAHLGQIGSAVSALNSNITWDGQITPTFLLGELKTPSATRYDTSLSFEDSWAVFSEADVTTGIELTNNQDLSQLSNMFVGGNRFASTTSRGNKVGIVIGGAVGYFTVSDVTVVGSLQFTKLLSVSDKSGVFGIDLTDGTINVPVDVYFSLAAHYITINLGTVINIDSDFTLTNGIRTNQTLVNSDGGSSNSVSTTVTIFDGNGNQVDTIASSVNSASANNVDVLGQQIADSVTNNTQTPINFNGSYDIATNVVTIRADQAGIHDDWVIDINNNGVLAGFQGNITASSAVSANEIINEIQVISFPDGTSQITGLPTPPSTGTVSLQSVNGVISWV